MGSLHRDDKNEIGWSGPFLSSVGDFHDFRRIWQAFRSRKR